MAYQPSPRFDEALAAMEAALAHPIVPGELEPWLAAVRETSLEFAEHMQQHFRDHHTAAYDQIVEDDAALIGRVGQLRNNQDKLREAFAHYLTQLKGLSQRAGKHQADEAAVLPQLIAMQDDGLARVVDIRKHEAAVSTWLVEAEYRDRGVAD